MGEQDNAYSAGGFGSLPATESDPGNFDPQAKELGVADSQPLLFLRE